jgi:hypothetical protein
MQCFAGMSAVVAVATGGRSPPLVDAAVVILAVVNAAPAANRPRKCVALLVIFCDDDAYVLPALLLPLTTASWILLVCSCLSHSLMYLVIASTFSMPHFALHAMIFALSAKEQDNNNLLSLPLVANNGSIGRALTDTNCLWRAYLKVVMMDLKQTQQYPSLEVHAKEPAYDPHGINFATLRK